MIEKVVKKRNLNDAGAAKDDLAYWLSKTPEERISAVEILRRHIMKIQPDFRELLALFNAKNVEYLIVGGYALVFHGAPRFS
jgi:2-hydroxy-3-keto-5-methylthiopentenyl-1-phosphate phosphatase